MRAFVKDPDATLDYTIDWGPWLNGDDIQTSSWTVPSGVTNVANDNTVTTARIFISGGTVGVNYTLTNRITTVGGRTDDRSIEIRVRER